MMSNEMNSIEAKIKSFIEKINTLESQKREEEARIEKHEQTKADIEMQDEMIYKYANEINVTKSDLSEKKRRFDFLKKIERACMLFSKIIIPGGSLFSLGVIIFNGVVAGMVSLLIFIALEIASISLSVSVFKKYKKLNGEMMGMENNLEDHKELLKGSAEAKKHLTNMLLSKETEQLSHINLANIQENITYYENQIRALLEKIPSELDTEYMSEVRNSYFGNTDSKVSVPRYIPNN